MPYTAVYCDFCRKNVFQIDKQYENFIDFMCTDCTNERYTEYIGRDTWKNTPEYKKEFTLDFYRSNPTIYCDNHYFRKMYEHINSELVEHLFDGLSSKKKRKSKKKSKSLKKRKSKKKSRRARV